MTNPRRILFMVTGSIAGFKAAQVVSSLVKAGCEVQVMATPSALKFVGAATFEGLTSREVVTDLWESGRAMDHIHLSRWADCGVICPASANTIAQMSLGLANDVVSATLLAWPKEKSVFVFPAMNSEMLSAEATQTHIKTLRSRGVLVAETGSGSLACGEVGDGRLLEPEQILQILNVEPNAVGARRVLITGGATRESIDGIRFISNVSSGRTASELCDHFSQEGWSVTYLHGQQAALPKNTTRTVPYSDTESLANSLRDELSHEAYDAVIHCAAVSDYTVSAVNDSARDTTIKITSGEDLTIRLKPTKKILPTLKEYSKNKNIRVIGFKLTLHAEAEQQTEAATKILSDGVDAIVTNDWSRIDAQANRHPGFVLNRDGRESFENVQEMASILTRIVQPKDTI